MELSNKTAREIYQDIKANPARKRFGFGNKAVLVNVDPQKAYTRTDLFKTAYETDPRQLEYIDTLAAKFRALGWPVVWTHVAYIDSGEDAGIWGREQTPRAHCRTSSLAPSATSSTSACILIATRTSSI